jgi:poly(A) polymerase
MKDSAVQIVRTLRERGFQAYLVGGCVRDLLLGREPADYDVATDATPNEVMSLFPKTYAVGAQFGVVLVDSDGRQPGADCVEVATFRNDGLYSDGRHPDDVRYTKDPKEDVQRRDFTINALLLDPLENDRVLDFVGGRVDLDAGVIRAIGDPRRRFTEDKLRMLRAVRFAARFGYEIESQTLDTIPELASTIHEVSHERVRDELTKMLTEGHARRAFELLDLTRLLPEVLHEVARMKGIRQPPEFHPEGDVWVHTLMLLESLPAGCSATLAWGALLHDVGKPPTFRVAPDRIRFDGHAEIGARMAEEICRRFRFSNEDTEKVVDLVSHHMRFPEVTRMRESTLKRLLGMPNFAEHLELHRMDCNASHRDLSLYDFVLEKLRALPEEQIHPPALINGDDLIAAGYRPGPRFKEILAACEDAQLEGQLQTKDQALAWVKTRFPVESKD